MGCRRVVCAALLAALVCPGRLAADEAGDVGAGTARQVVVTIRDGALAGSDVDGVTAFKGIPYAAPPLGALRWKPPRPPARWPDVRLATHFGPSCAQQALPGLDVFLGPTSEDCLYLNLWRPDGVPPGAKLPVMVWIHGGAFLGGGSAARFVDGTSLARRGVIVVSFNYRLGRPGWFALPALTREARQSGTASASFIANYGLMDQIAALRWVAANIAAFGGDPARVTVFGESAGAMSVNLLMSVPAARGLFARAITESGLGGVAPMPRADAEALGTRFAQGLGTDDPATLRRLPVDALLDAGGDQLRRGPRPILDGRLIVASPMQQFAAGREAPVPWLVGSNGFDASLFVGNRAGPIARRINERVFTGPDRALAALHARNGQPVYRYLFTYVRSALRDKVAGATHGSNVPFVFGTLGSGFVTQTDAADRRMVDLMQQYWVNFATTGDPNRAAPATAGGRLPLWPKDDGGNLLVIDGAGPLGAHAVHESEPAPTR